MKDENYIQNEIDNCPKFLLENDSPSLTPDNVYLAEFIFHVLYRKSELGKLYDSLEKDYRKDNLVKILSVINSENSTHLLKKDKEAIAEHIIKEYKTFEAFKNALKHKENEKYTYTLVSSIRSLKSACTGPKTERDNYSFATKFCHYSCYYLFKNCAELRDLYPIYDGIIVKYLKDYHNVKEKELSDYISYVNKINEIVKDKKISKNGFDHLIWLYHR